VADGVKVEHDFQLKALLYKGIYLLEINWCFRCIIMVQSGVSGQISGSSNKAILQTVLEKSVAHVHSGSLLFLFFMYKPFIQTMDFLCFRAQLENRAPCGKKYVEMLGLPREVWVFTLLACVLKG